MNTLNYEFFDAFKQLDKICKEIYGDVASNNKLGVTLYLEDMDKKAYAGGLNIEGWNSDYMKLKRVRNIRNDLAHSENSFSYENCTMDDIDFVRSFYLRILNQSDPIALLERENNKRTSKAPQSQATPQRQLPSTNYERKSFPFGCLTFITLFIIVLLSVIAIFIN